MTRVVLHVNAPQTESERLTHEVRRIRSDAYTAESLGIPDSAAVLTAYAAELDEKRISVQQYELRKATADANRRSRRASRRRTLVACFPLHLVVPAVLLMAIVGAMLYATSLVFGMQDRHEENVRESTSLLRLESVQEAKVQVARESADWVQSSRYRGQTEIRPQCPSGTTLWITNYVPGRTRCFDEDGVLLGLG